MALFFTVVEDSFDFQKLMNYQIHILDVFQIDIEDIQNDFYTTGREDH